MKIEGSIEDIIYRNEENGYTVALLDFNGTLVTIVGKMISANIGENISVEGDFSVNKKYIDVLSFITTLNTSFSFAFIATEKENRINANNSFFIFYVLEVTYYYNFS